MSMNCGRQIHRATANIIEPTGESDNPLKFTSGLVVALDIDATLEHVQDPQNTVKVQVSLKHDWKYKLSSSFSAGKKLCNYSVRKMYDQRSVTGFEL